MASILLNRINACMRASVGILCPFRISAACFQLTLVTYCLHGALRLGGDFRRKHWKNPPEELHEALSQGRRGWHEPLSHAMSSTRPSEAFVEKSPWQLVPWQPAANTKCCPGPKIVEKTKRTWQGLEAQVSESGLGCHTVLWDPSAYSGTL